ncbi:hypothetical protein H6P81_004772 [Aristolochia fimbriata]|uniref:AP2/ERF domain-containing protein n=1 Tax=Aristolochia fimbriata TaxID=158543 RepID=A0AAV7ESP7_ARIFI|nr:hypothetical protein H6P81_004772 [Aristolochia fimbriata]
MASSCRRAALPDSCISHILHIHGFSSSTKIDERMSFLSFFFLPSPFWKTCMEQGALERASTDNSLAERDENGRFFFFFFFSRDDTEIIVCFCLYVANRETPVHGLYISNKGKRRRRHEELEIGEGGEELMEMVLVKNEENGGCVRRRVSVGEAGESTKCIKRRRRDPLGMVRRGDHHHQDKNGEKVGVDQSAAPTTTAGGGVAAAKRSSRFRGVSRHRWTGRFEAHLWDKGSWNATQKKKGKQGAYDEEESAARAYDLAALKYWGPTTFTNFPVSDYEKEIQIMQNVTKEEYLASLRRKSSGFSRGVSKYRGVARHHHNGRWEARIGRVFGNKYLYLGTYSTQEEAAAAYDIAAIEYRGINAVTNFDLSTYIRWLRPGSNNLLVPQEQPRPCSAETRAMAPLAVPTINTTTISTTTTTNVHKEEAAGGETCFGRYNPFFLQADDLVQSRQISAVPCNRTSPTALGLLLRSSIFRELVEKNSSAAEIFNSNNNNNNNNNNEIEGDIHQQIIGEQQDVIAGPGDQQDEFHGVFYDGIGDVPSFLCSSTSNGVALLPAMELHEYYDRPHDGQGISNLDVLNMSSIH